MSDGGWTGGQASLMRAVTAVAGAAALLATLIGAPAWGTAESATGGLPPAGTVNASGEADGPAPATGAVPSAVGVPSGASEGTTASAGGSAVGVRTPATGNTPDGEGAERTISRDGAAPAWGTAESATGGLPPAGTAAPDGVVRS